MTDMTIPSKDASAFSAYIAFPKTTPAPSVIVIQEIFGVNDGMRAKCDWLAEQGYIAVCPDLFWRLEPGVQLTDKTKEEWDKALALMNRFDVDKGIEDLKAVRHVLRGHAQGTGKVGCLGYCLGGKLAYLMATRSDIDASVGYYGVGLDQLMAEANNIQKPLMLHIAEEDKFTGKDAQKAIADALADNKNATVHSYPGMDHAFTRVGGEHYDADAAKLADTRTLDFLKTSLA